MDFARDNNCIWVGEVSPKNDPDCLLPVFDRIIKEVIKQDPATYIKDDPVEDVEANGEKKKCVIM